MALSSKYVIIVEPPVRTGARRAGGARGAGGARAVGMPGVLGG